MANDDVERVRTAMADLCEPLHDVFTWADERRRAQLPELDGDPDYRWHATHTVRALAHLRLNQTKDRLGVWVLAGNHARNGELWLAGDGYRTRVLHAVHDADVPPPGGNDQRRAFYRNPPLFQPDPQQRLVGPDNDRLLVVWRIDPRSGVPVFRVVRPIGEWTFGGHALTDLDFILPETAEDLATMEFQPSDEGMELDIPNDDEQEGGSTDAGGSAG